MKKPTFWLIGGTFAFMSLNHGIIISHLLPIFYDRGLDAKTAVLAASCIGPMQVVGRLMMLASEKRYLCSRFALYLLFQCLWLVGQFIWEIFHSV